MALNATRVRTAAARNATTAAGGGEGLGGDARRCGSWRAGRARRCARARPPRSGRGRHLDVDIDAAPAIGQPVDAVEVGRLALDGVDDGACGGRRGVERPPRRRDVGVGAGRRRGRSGARAVRAGPRADRAAVNSASRPPAARSGRASTRRGRPARALVLRDRVGHRQRRGREQPGIVHDPGQQGQRAVRNASRGRRRHRASVPQGRGASIGLSNGRWSSCPWCGPAARSARWSSAFLALARKAALRPARGVTTRRHILDIVLPGRAGPGCYKGVRSGRTPEAIGVRGVEEHT